jgi:hypothetical protein
MNDKNKKTGNAPKAATDGAKKERRPAPAPGKVDLKIKQMLLTGITVDEYAQACGINRGSALVRLKKAVQAGALVQTSGPSVLNVLDTLFTVGSAARVRAPQVFTLKTAEPDAKAAE